MNPDVFHPAFLPRAFFNTHIFVRKTFIAHHTFKISANCNISSNFGKYQGEVRHLSHA